MIKQLKRKLLFVAVMLPFVTAIVYSFIQSIKA